MSLPPRASIILLNYNTAALSIAALESLSLHLRKPSSYQIILVDNASNDDDFLQLRSGVAALHKLQVQLVRSRINLGFGGGHMYGVQHASGAHYVFLNSDLRFTEDCISPLVSFLEVTPDAALVGAQEYDAHGGRHKSFHYPLELCSEIFGQGLLHKLMPRRYPDRRSVITEPTVVGSVPGSLMVTRAADFDAVGGFDTHIFLYYEEKDLAFRLREKTGKFAYLYPACGYVHLKGESTDSSARIQQELKLSQHYAVRKNLGAWAYFILLSYSIFQSAVKAAFRVKHRRLLLCYLRGAPLTLSLRHEQSLQAGADTLTAPGAKARQ